MNGINTITQIGAKTGLNNRKLSFKSNYEYNAATNTASKSLSKEKKIGIGALSALAIAGGITYAILRKPKYQKDIIKETKKYFFDNINELHLSENLKLPEFNTREEALKYAKETFKINEIEDNIPFEAIKDILNAITDISNKNKGNFYCTHKIKLLHGDTASASIEGKAWEKNFGSLSIYKHLYDIKQLDKYLSDELKPMLYDNSNNPIFLFKDGIEEPINMVWNEVPAHYNLELSRLVNKYYTSADKMTLKEKQNLVLSLYNVRNQTYIASETPMTMFKYLQKETPELLGEFNINIEEIEKKPHEEQVRILKQLMSNLVKNGRGKFKIYGIKRMEDSIYHEFGHLQDAIKNKDIVKKPTDYSRRYATKEKIDELKTKYDWFEEPEFIKNINEQTIAAEVSHYSTESVGEFIAETYEKLIKGENVSDEVMTLYKKYNGPLIN